MSIARKGYSGIGGGLKEIWSGGGGEVFLMK